MATDRFRRIFGLVLSAIPSPEFMRPAACLLLACAVLIALNLISLTAGYLQTDNLFFRDGRFSLSEDFGYGERFEYLLSAVCIYVFVRLHVAMRQPIYLVLAALHGWILLDNAAQLHETGGLALAAVFGFAGQSPGEAIILGGVAFCAVVAIAWGLARSTGPHDDIGLICILLIGVFAFFGGVVDALHAAIGDQIRALDRAMGLIEDGGEMLALAINCAFAWFLMRTVLRGRSAGLRPVALPPLPDKAA